MRIDSTSADPFYQQIKDSLRAQIASGKIKVGACIPDERSLADSLNVSRKTTRRAILELAEEGLLRRVRGKGTFVRDILVRNSESRRNCVLVASTGNSLFGSGSPYYAKILRGIYESIEELGLSLAFEPMISPYDKFLSRVRRDSVRGVIVIWAIDQDLLQHLKRLNVPVVRVDSESTGESPFDLVTHDGESGVYAAVKHLIDLGHRDILFMRPDNMTTNMQQRLDGYKRALSEAGLRVRPERIVQAGFVAEAVYASVSRMLKSGSQPTAIVCIGDEQAIGAMAAVTDFGWRVPEHMSVIGFGDSGHFTSPKLSTVRVSTHQMGAMAMRLLEMRVAHPESPPQRVILPVEWLSYHSCGAPRAEGPLKPTRRTR
ncbi:MAG: GntR family transcriptional regulator [Planctomycetes bacterium]|nr:GntR family transcriptional regulator [Planctomycetota bacterium]